VYRAKALKHLAATADKGVTKSLVDVVFDKNNFSRELVQVWEQVTRNVVQRAGDELYKEIGQDDPWKLTPSKVTAFIRQRDNKISGVADTAFNQLKTALQAGVDNGETTEDLSDRVRDVFNNLSNYASPPHRHDRDERRLRVQPPRSDDRCRRRIQIMVVESRPDRARSPRRR
jgi:hypothetical protein